MVAAVTTVFGLDEINELEAATVLKNKGEQINGFYRVEK